MGLLVDANNRPIEDQPEPAQEPVGAPEGSPPPDAPANPLEPILEAMRAFQGAANVNPATAESKDEARKHLGTALETFAKAKGYRASLGKDYTIGILETPKGLRVDVNENTSRGKELLRAWEAFIHGMEEGAKEAMLHTQLQMLANAINAQDGVINSLLLRVADLESKVRG